MSYTSEITVDNSDWVVLADQANGATSAFVQLPKDRAGPVLIYVGQSAPGAATTVGTMLNDPGLREISILALEAGDAVYGKSLQDEDNQVTVTAPGTAPGA